MIFIFRKYNFGLTRPTLYTCIIIIIITLKIIIYKIKTLFKVYIIGVEILVKCFTVSIQKLCISYIHSTLYIVVRFCNNL